MFNSELNSLVCCSRDINKYIVDIGFFLDAIDNTFTETSILILWWSHTWIILSHLSSCNTAMNGSHDMYTQSPRAAGLMIYISGRLWVAVLQLLCYTFLVRVKLWLYIDVGCEFDCEYLIWCFCYYVTENIMETVKSQQQYHI